MYICVAMDYFPISGQEAATYIAKVLINEFFCRFGVPNELHSVEQGSIANVVGLRLAILLASLSGKS